MDRYSNTNQVKDPNTNNRVYESTIYPAMDPQYGDLYIITVQGDTLEDLANKYYQDVTKWVVIAQANHIGHGTTNIIAGSRIRIPSDPNKFQIGLNNQR